jgi:hypothetical protein
MRAAQRCFYFPRELTLLSFLALIDSLLAARIGLQDFTLEGLMEAARQRPRHAER